MESQRPIYHKTKPSFRLGHGPHDNASGRPQPAAGMRYRCNRAIGITHGRHDDEIRALLLRPVILLELRHILTATSDQLAYDTDVMAQKNRACACKVAETVKGPVISTYWQVSRDGLSHRDGGNDTLELHRRLPALRTCGWLSSSLRGLPGVRSRAMAQPSQVHRSAIWIQFG